jgi:hypothetical protein
MVTITLVAVVSARNGLFVFFLLHCWVMWCITRIKRIKSAYGMNSKTLLNEGKF